jgi:hypothetical protein
MKIPMPATKFQELKKQPKISAFKLLVWLAVTLSTATAEASVVPIGSGAFPAASPLIAFDGLVNPTEANGLTVAGVLISYSIGNGNVAINDQGPGSTNNLDPLYLVSIGNATGLLTLSLPGLFDQFGFGWAVFTTIPVANATTLTLFNGATNVGALSYNGVPDPTFAGGFAGIRSSLPFNRVTIKFNAGAGAPAFVVDNFIMSTAVPEPSTILLMLSGVAGLLWGARRRIS